MLLSLAFKEIKKHFLMSVIILIELSITILLAVIMVSSLLIRTRYYTPFKDAYSQNGLYCEFTIASTNGVFFESADDLICDEDILKYLPKADRIISSNKMFAMPVYNNEYVASYCYSLNDEMIKRYHPELVAGEWLHTQIKDDYIEAVISHNQYGWKTGDIIPINLQDSEDNKLTPVKIVGEFKDGCKIAGIAHEHDGSNDYNMLFTQYDFGDEEIPLLLFSSSQVSALNAPQCLNVAIINYGDDISDDELSRNQKTVSSFGSPFSIRTKEINNNSYDFFKQQIYNYLPIIIVVLIMTSTSCISISALSIRQRLHDYAVYCLCGFIWNKCYWFNAIIAVILNGVAIIVSLILLACSNSIIFLEDITIVWGWELAAAILIISVFYIIISMIMPIIIIHNNSIKHVLSNTND